MDQHPEYKTDMSAQQTAKAKEDARMNRKATNDERKTDKTYRIFKSLALALDHENADLVATKAMDIFERDAGKDNEGVTMTDFSNAPKAGTDERDETSDPTADNASSLTDDGSYTPGDKRAEPVAESNTKTKKSK